VLLRRCLILLFFTALGFFAMGYHPGIEDDGVYLTAVKANLNPSLYSHNSVFFRAELQSSSFDGWMAGFVRITHISLAWAALLWQLAAIVIILYAAWSIIRQFFPDESAQWGGVALLAAMFTLPVSGTAIYILDQHLHPRALATALILLAVSRLVSGKRWQGTVALLLLAVLLHPIMGALGAAFCVIVGSLLIQPSPIVLPELPEVPEMAKTIPAVAAFPMAWLFNRPHGVWLASLQSRHWFCLYRWTWYEWLGVLAPLAIFWLIARLERSRGNLALARFAAGIALYGGFFLAVSMVVLAPDTPTGLGTLEPMRFLHLIYVFLCLFGGAYLGRYVLQKQLWRWALFLILANGGMFLAQRQLFAATPHLELPGITSSNPWLQAFAWIRQNTPQDAYFALDPHYMSAPGEDYHSFRALAERSSLSDAIKDASVVTKVPDLGPVWQSQQQAQQGWNRFTLANFENLRDTFGVDWVLVAYPATAGLACPWHNRSLAVCQISPEPTKLANERSTGPQ